MPRQMIIDWVSQTYQDRSPNSSSRRAVNCYFQSTEGEGKTEAELIGTPGTLTFTRAEGVPVAITSIQGDGASPNTVTVNTTAPHGLSEGQTVNIEGTTNYNEPEVVVATVGSTTQYTYETLSNTEYLAEVSGSSVPTMESPITDVSQYASCRGLYTTSKGRVFTCYAGEVFEIFIDGTWASIYSIGDASTVVSFADDGFRLVFVDGSQLYVYEFATGTVTTPSVDFAAPTKAVFLNGRIVVYNADSANNNDNKFYWCDLYRADLWDPLSYASAESSADPITGMAVREGELWLFGPRSYEVWRPDTNPDLPYSKVGGSSTEIGCGASNSVTSIAGQVFWLGSSSAGQNVIFMSNGYGSQRISTHAIEFALNTLGGITVDAVGFAYQQEGHTFYVLNLIQANRTFVYDLSNAKWHERSTRDQLINQANRWDPLFATYAFNTVLVGALQNARILTLHLDKYTEWDGRPIVRLYQGPIIFQELSQVFHSEFQVDMETGVGRQQGEPYNSGVQTGYAENPVISLQHSDDGGHTWSSERTTSLGKVGQYLTRARWRRLGRSRARVYRIAMSSPVKWHVLGARMIANLGRNP